MRSETIQLKVRIRSRQQRLFERRAKMVKAKEENHWKQVTPDMMSEEEDQNGEFIRHHPQCILLRSSTKVKARKNISKA